ncbi:hypoxanthine-guanine phosphoribosyltransferase [Balamuthia mandrillaris]
MAEKQYWSYESIHQLVCELATAVKDFRADIMVAIGGGGFIPARILRTYIHVPILAVGLELYDDTTNRPRENPIKTQWFDEHTGGGEGGSRLKGKRVLVVDEVDDSRTTLQYCVEELRKTFQPERVGVVVLHNKKKEKRGVLPADVDYFCGEEIEDKWVVYPWDATDIYAHQAAARAQQEAAHQQHHQHENNNVSSSSSSS